jgi:integral membrane protein
MTESKPTQDQARIASALTRYRVLAWTTGLWLLVLTAEVIAKYGYDVDNFGWVGIVHGWVYLVFLIVTADLAIKVRWPAGKTILTLLSGTIPFLSFFVEHIRTKEVKRRFLT